MPYRSAQPGDIGRLELREFGIKTVVNLRAFHPRWLNRASPDTSDTDVATTADVALSAVAAPVPGARVSVPSSRTGTRAALLFLPGCCGSAKCLHETPTAGSTLRCGICRRFTAYGNLPAIAAHGSIKHSAAGYRLCDCGLSTPGTLTHKALSRSGARRSLPAKCFGGAPRVIASTRN